MYRGGPEEQRTALQQGLEVGGQAQLLTSTLLSASSSFLHFPSLPDSHLRLLAV